MDMRKGIRRAGLGAVAAGALLSIVSGSIWAYQAVGAGRSGTSAGARQAGSSAPTPARTDSTAGRFLANELTGLETLGSVSIWALPGPVASSLHVSPPLDFPMWYRLPDGLRGLAVLVKVGRNAPRWTLTNARTGFQLIDALDIRLASADRMRPFGQTLLVQGMTLQVIQIRTRKVTLTEAVPYGTITRYTDSMPVGDVSVLQEGAAGRALRTYSITYRNGRTVRRQLLSETVMSEPVTRILERGTSYTAPAVSGGAAAAVAAAYSVLGVPYVYGGASPSTGFDCSGLTMWAWAQGGVSLPHSASGQYSATRRVSRSDLQPGDLLFFYSGITHVGIYVGGGQMIMAHKTGTYVQLDALSSYWWGVYQGAGRPG